MAAVKFPDELYVRLAIECHPEPVSDVAKMEAELWWAYRCEHGWKAMQHQCAVFQLCQGILSDDSYPRATTQPVAITQRVERGSDG
jgi:hypothetical protein